MPCAIYQAATNSGGWQEFVKRVIQFISGSTQQCSGAATGKERQITCGKK